MWALNWQSNYVLSHLFYPNAQSVCKSLLKSAKRQHPDSISRGTAIDNRLSDKFRMADVIIERCTFLNKRLADLKRCEVLLR
jgi:hypothetical protein